MPNGAPAWGRRTSAAKMNLVRARHRTAGSHHFPFGLHTGIWAALIVGVQMNLHFSHFMLTSRTFHLCVSTLGYSLPSCRLFIVGHP